MIDSNRRCTLNAYCLNYICVGGVGTQWIKFEKQEKEKENNTNE